MSALFRTDMLSSQHSDAAVAIAEPAMACLLAGERPAIVMPSGM